MLFVSLFRAQLHVKHHRMDSRRWQKCREEQNAFIRKCQVHRSEGIPGMSVVSWQGTAFEYVGTRVPPRVWPSSELWGPEQHRCLIVTTCLNQTNTNVERNKKCFRTSHLILHRSWRNKHMKYSSNWPKLDIKKKCIFISFAVIVKRGEWHYLHRSVETAIKASEAVNE